MKNDNTLLQPAQLGQKISTVSYAFYEERVNITEKLKLLKPVNQIRIKHMMYENSKTLNFNLQFTIQKIT